MNEERETGWLTTAPLPLTKGGMEKKEAMMGEEEEEEEEREEEEGGATCVEFTGPRERGGRVGVEADVEGEMYGKVEYVGGLLRNSSHSSRVPPKCTRNMPPPGVRKTT